VDRVAVVFESEPVVVGVVALRHELLVEGHVEVTVGFAQPQFVVSV